MITGRLLETIGFVTIIFLHKVKERYFALIFGAIATPSVISLFFGIFPDCKGPVNTIIAELENERKYLKQLAYYDQLTGLYSRNFFEELLKKQTAIIEREKISSEVIIIDIDNFKKINGSYGHVAGDKVLRFVAECIKESIRSSDTAVPYGGDEFVIVLSETSEGQKTSSKELGTNSNRKTTSISLSI